MESDGIYFLCPVTTLSAEAAEAEISSQLPLRHILWYENSTIYFSILSWMGLWVVSHVWLIGIPLQRESCMSFREHVRCFHGRQEV